MRVPEYGDEVQYEMKKLSPDDEESLGDFNCGNNEIDDYLKNRRKREEAFGAVTYIYKERRTEKVIAFASISCSGIRYEYQNVIQTIPAIEVRYFAVLNELHKMVFDKTDKHFYLSDKLFCDLIGKCREISVNHIGADYMILYAVPDAVRFYKRNAFKDYIEYMASDKNRYLEGCTPMYADL